MEFSEVPRQRRMVRRDTDGPLAPEVVERVLDTALCAPSAGASQGWALQVLTEPADRARSSIRADQREGSTRELDILPECDPVGGITVGHRHPDLAPQDATGIEERREEDVAHRGHW